MFAGDVIDRTLGDILFFTKPFTVQEVPQALKQMKGRKAPRLEGLQSCILHKFWHIQGSKVNHMVLGVLNNDEDISIFNDSNIALISKIKSPNWLRIIGLFGLVVFFISCFLVLLLSIGLRLICLRLSMTLKVLLLKRGSQQTLLLWPLKLSTLCNKVR